MRWFIKKFGLPLFMLAVGIVVLGIGILIMYYYKNNITVYIAFSWCIIWAFINEGFMMKNEKRDKQ